MFHRSGAVSCRSEGSPRGTPSQALCGGSLAAGLPSQSPSVTAPPRGEPLAKRGSFPVCQGLPSLGEVARRRRDGEVFPRAGAKSPPGIRSEGEKLYFRKRVCKTGLASPVLPNRDHRGVFFPAFLECTSVQFSAVFLVVGHLKFQIRIITQITVMVGITRDRRYILIFI